VIVRCGHSRNEATGAWLWSPSMALVGWFMTQSTTATDRCLSLNLRAGLSALNQPMFRCQPISLYAIQYIFPSQFDVGDKAKGKAG